MRAAVLADYIGLAREMSLNPGEMLRQVGLSESMLGTHERLIPVEAVVRLLDLSATQAGCPTFGLRLAERRQVSHFGISSLLLIHQPTLGMALRVGLQYLHLLNQSLALYLDVGAEAVTLREEILNADVRHFRQTIELGLAANVQLIRAVVGPQWRPLSVHFRHPAPPSLEVHHRVFGCRCVFDDELYGVRWPAGDMTLPNPHADPVMAQYGRRLVEMTPAAGAGSVVAQVQRLLHIFLPLGRATIKQVAPVLGMSVRQLQRHLERQAVDFSDLLCATRRELVLQYLASENLDIGQIGRLLGFARHTSFTRWFVQQYAEPPLAHRRRLAEELA